MKELLKQINETRIEILLTIEEAQILRHYLEKQNEEKGIPTDNNILNKCPICSSHFTKEDHYCPNCGQKVRFNESDILPL